MDVSLVIVCHRSSRVLPGCVGSFRREAATAGVETEIIAVEHSEDPAELDRVRAAGVDRVLELPNRGYAAGLNAGARAATGEMLLLANPDISFFEGSLAALLDALGLGYDVVGPQFVWDEDGEVLLPAAEDPAPHAELVRAVRRRSPRAWLAGLPLSLDREWRLWTADGARDVACLRGALLAVTRETLDRFGPFDEGYFLYYEETEWLWRARRRGARLALVGTSRVQHRWGHATGQNNGEVGQEERSRRRFVERNYSPVWRRVLGSGGRHHRSPLKPIRLVQGGSPPEIENDLWLASPNPHLMPALGVVRSPSLPPDFVDFCRAWRWVVATASRPGGRWKIDRAWTWKPS
ncbi:MAG: glycosyltransferase [Acidobacteria bacterium]|jgi:GT2 family glycosyltransferase|nr:glycosyltransferase [Acidobacteriota bacterium]